MNQQKNKRRSKRRASAASRKKDRAAGKLPTKVTVLSVRAKISKELSILVLNLDPTANVVSSAVSVYSSVLGSGTRPRFLSPWTKYGPPFISSDQMSLVQNEIGISKLNKKIEERYRAKKEGNFAKADEIRDQLKKMGVLLKDSPEGTTWEVAR